MYKLHVFIHVHCMYNVLYMYIYMDSIYYIFTCANALVVWLYELLTFNFILVMCTHPFLLPALSVHGQHFVSPGRWLSTVQKVLHVVCI